jgi:tetratricopeptide (TPR) repeat protein
MRATALWWRIQLDPASHALDSSFEKKVDAAIDECERWAARDGKRADAWFFVGAAYGLRVQYRALRLERLAAARDGKRIKDALEKCLSIDSSLQDAYFGIGLYHYYADIAPAALKMLRWMLMLPGGDRVQGLREMLRARDRGELLRGEADFQLHLIYLWYEQNTDEALRLLDGLRSKYPHNPVFLRATADVHEIYRHDAGATLDVWRQLDTLARNRQVAVPEASEALARIGMGAALDALFDTDEAIEQFRAVVSASPSAPAGALARAQVKLGAAYDRMGARDLAVAAYRAALAAATPDDVDGVKAVARAGLSRTPDARLASAYRLSLEGWRHLQHGELAAAAESLNRAAAITPGDPLTRFRLASLQLARGRKPDALAEFEKLAALQPAPAPPVLASSCLEAGRLLEANGDRTRAAEMYGRAARARGAATETRHAASQAADRLKSKTTAGSKD